MIEPKEHAIKDMQRWNGRIFNNKGKDIDEVVVEIKLVSRHLFIE